METQTQSSRKRRNPLEGARARALGEQHLTFTLGKDVFGMSISHIREILQFESLTEVPLTPAFVRGVLNVRGAVVPVIDLSVRFDRALTEVGKKTCVVILEVPAGDEDKVVIGVLVDQVNEVLEIDPEGIEPAPSFGSSVRSDFVRGVSRRENGFILILDVAQVLSVAELASLTGAQ
jgi:purine-binding chemotaxis protein CheW